MERWCPICSVGTASRFCPTDRIATLLRAPPPFDASQVEVGSVIGDRYEIQKKIGQGGYAQVFQARHVHTGHELAVKILAADVEDDAVAMRRFFLEARITSALRHPNTVRVFDFGQDDSGLTYLAMELLCGRSLRQELRQRQAEERVFSEHEAIDIGVAVTRSLGEAHAAGLVHRDLKPQNIFLHRAGDDLPMVKVLDFGIAKLGALGVTTSKTSSVGTPAYMSPEQALASAIDGRSDLYSLGIMLFTLTTGRPPFRGESVAQTIFMQLHDRPPDVRERSPNPISPAFADLIRRAMEKDPSDRFQDAREMREALLSCRQRDAPAPTVVEIEDSEASEVSRPSPLETTKPSPVELRPALIRGDRRRFALAAIIVICLGSGAALLSQLAGTEAPQPEPMQISDAPPLSSEDPAQPPSETRLSTGASESEGVEREVKPAPKARRQPSGAAKRKQAKDILKLKI